MPTVKPPRRPSSDTAASTSDVSTSIRHYICGGYPGLYVVSAEEQRVEAEFESIAAALDYGLFPWSVVSGLMDLRKQTVRDVCDPMDVLEEITKIPEKSIVLLKDFHLFLVDPNPILLRKFKDTLYHAKTTQKVVVVVGCRLVLPAELERELTTVEFSLPDKDGLKVVLDGIVESAKLSALNETEYDKAIEAASGLTTMEAENAFALSVAQSRTVVPSTVYREKAKAVKKGGLLEIVDSKGDLSGVGGLDQLKDWLVRRKDAFGQRAIDYGLPSLKGLLIIGIPGTGKSLTAKATAAVFNIPLIRLDAGKLYGGLVGQSEANLRSVINTVEAIAPCCLWIDELEKGFAGSKSSGSSDGGTSARVFGSFLSWMQEKEKPVFVVATANDVSQLPPEMLRKGRFDEIFFVDLPVDTERQAIWKIVVERYNRHSNDFDLVQLSRMTEGLTGAEIEALFVGSMFSAFERSKEPTDLDIAASMDGVFPLSKLMAEQIVALKQWSQGRARLATSPAKPTERKLRKLGV